VLNMSTPGIALGTQGKFQFAKDGKFLENHVGVGISVDVPTSSDLAVALANNTPFPAGTIKLAQIGVKIDGDTGDIKFGEGQGLVSFKGTGAFGSGLGVYEDVSQMLSDLDPDKKFLDRLEIDGRGIKRFVALNWNYNLAASLNGSVGLGAGSA